jgi:hypothetical protein
LFRVLEKGRGRRRRRWRVWFWLENGGGEERMMKDAASPNFGLTENKTWIQSILKKDWSKTDGISKFLADCQFILAEIEISFRLKKKNYYG